MLIVLSNRTIDK